MWILLLIFIVVSLLVILRANLKANGILFVYTGHKKYMYITRMDEVLASGDDVKYRRLSNKYYLVYNF